MHICHARHYSTLRNVHYRKKEDSFIDLTHVVCTMIFVHKFISDLTGEIPASIRVKRLGSVCLSGVVSESNRKWSMGKRMVT